MKTKLNSPSVLFAALSLVAALGYGCSTKNSCCGSGAMRAVPAPALTKLPPPLPAPASQAEKMAWFREAKYGLFIHWGLYCQPAGEWKGKPVAGIGEWIMNRAQIPVTEYAGLAKTFNPEQFDAEAWVQMARDAGMKYIVITSKHHDGFAMYHSLVSPYNITDATPFQRDPIRELAQACAKHDIKFGFYYSQSQDWHEPGGMGNTWDFGPDDVKDKNGAYDQYLREKAEPQVAELLQNYGPICLIWFDTARVMNVNNRGPRFIDLVHKYQPACLIDGRLGVAGDYVSTGDNVIPNAEQAGDWEVPATVNHTWGFKQDDTDWKAPGDILFKLVDIASKGGNYLLNVGPTSAGVIPSECQSNLLTTGRWLKVNGEAVYGAGRSPFGEEFGDYSTKLKDANGKPVYLAFTDWRCTTRPGKLYFTIFKMPRGGFPLPAFKNEIKKTYLLSDASQADIPITTTNSVRLVTVPRDKQNAMANVVVVDISGDQVER
ncbi:MAG TPA: alpha-L-fucosidase [Verrucomicrobiae bacterium]|nr:alpha-L-fucosidase [Verrucomicrobiae bacterium]